MPPDVVAPDPDSLEGMVTVSVVLDGTVVTINFLLSKSVDEKLELVIALKLSNNMISPADILCAPLKVIVTDVDPLVVVNALVSVVVDLIGCMS